MNGLELKQFVPSSVCLQCDGCCRFADSKSHWRPVIAREEQEAFKNHIEEDQRLKTVCPHGEHQCVFFNEKDRTCRVYRERPFECRLYPFVIFKKGAKVVLGAHLNCPHVEKYNSDDSFLKYVDYLKNFFNTPSTKTLLKNNQNLALSYGLEEKELQELFEINV